MIEDFKLEMIKKYEMSDSRLLYFFLGIENYQYVDEVFICQKKYAEKTLKKLGWIVANQQLLLLLLMRS